ncbi:MAG: PilZ domain-containing protein [Deltaproteobacteria bacterium]|nr:PilZ domain-containing protein [Deltaproteobacteria bacterium]MBW2199972.1 PilZ domain-containing protein [Deltaproteobacteria bacterium]MBW2538533.1 PilZ domain-containing protein [Deltaproteobacteria bacterium]
MLEKRIGKDRRSGIDRRLCAAPYDKGPERRITDRRSEIDKRKHIRYWVKDHILVNLKSESKSNHGQLLDISKGGLAFYYFANAKKPKNYSELGIFPSNDDFAIARIPCKTVSDTKMINESPFGTKILRRHSIRFENLTPAQKIKMDYFLRNYTLGEA